MTIDKWGSLGQTNEMAPSLEMQAVIDHYRPMGCNGLLAA